MTNLADRLQAHRLAKSLSWEELAREISAHARADGRPGTTYACRTIRRIAAGDSKPQDQTIHDVTRYLEDATK